LELEGTIVAENF